jgi:hypothetical protein
VKAFVDLWTFATAWYNIPFTLALLAFLGLSTLQFLGLEHDHDADTGGRFYRASRAGLFQHRKHNHIPAPEMSFTQPNLPNLIREIETLIEKTLED